MTCLRQCAKELERQITAADPLEKEQVDRRTWLRLVFLFGRLNAARRATTAKELAAAYEVSERTIRRDIAALQQAGLDIRSQMDDPSLQRGYVMFNSFCPFCCKATSQNSPNENSNPRHP
ncbi:MAG: HTH domain-containing protein [Verrucomicrobiae bacterium]|nr:HTH domain-containing protein [Verrucomicrobiae bacterium]